jgi:hypothetical protein
VDQFRYLGTTKTNENVIEEEIKRRLNSGNASFIPFRGGVEPSPILLRPLTGL